MFVSTNRTLNRLNNHKARPQGLDTHFHSLKDGVTKANISLGEKRVSFIWELAHQGPLHLLKC